MPEDITCIYGDGTQRVEVTETEVTITDGDAKVAMSRAAFREVVLGWERLLEEEAEKP